MNQNLEKELFLFKFNLKKLKKNFQLKFLFILKKKNKINMCVTIH